MRGYVFWAALALVAAVSLFAPEVWAQDPTAELRSRVSQAEQNIVLIGGGLVAVAVVLLLIASAIMTRILWTPILICVVVGAILGTWAATRGMFGLA